jgi:hypothetical protein
VSAFSKLKITNSKLFFSKNKKILVNLIFKDFEFAGVDSDGVTPDPIPTSAVKPVCGDGTAG